MGGTVALTIRTAEDIEYRMASHTSILHQAIDSVGMLEKDPAHLKAVLEERQHRRHPYNLCAPESYGLVVVDFVTNTILDSQDYGRLGRTYTKRVTNALAGVVEEGEEELQRFEALFKAGKIRCIGLNGREFSLEGETLENIYEKLRRAPSRLPDADDHWFFGDFLLDMSPFTLREYPVYNAPQARKMKQDILDLGFALGEDDEAAWEEWFNYCHEFNEGEEEDDGSETGSSA